MHSSISINQTVNNFRILLMHTDVSVPLGLRAAAVKSTSMIVSQTLAGMEQHVL
jgi:hypothetical protein